MKRKTTRGRPKFPSSQARKKGVLVRLTEAEFKTLRKAGKESGKPTSVYIREVALDFAGFENMILHGNPKDKPKGLL